MLYPWIEQIEAAKDAHERRAIIDELGRLRGWKVSRVYAELAKAGWSSGRKRRADAGSTSLSRETLSMAAALVHEGIRKNGKAVMTVPVVRSILEQNGIMVGVGDSRLRALLREAKLDRKSLAKPAPSQRMRSEHPNHVHQVDPSRALLYYSPDGRQHLIRDDEAYKNKVPKAWKQAQLWRYVLTDHYSSSWCVRYYESDGEKQENMWDFLLYAWAPKEDPLYAFHGLPELLIWDAGSANQAKAIQRALRSLRVENLAHTPGNPRAKGSVEKANHLVEFYLESRLRVEPVANVQELNGLAARLCAAFNANAIPGMDTTLVRERQRIGSRLSLWQSIAAADLRELPDAEDCRLLLLPEPETRTVDGRLAVTYSHPKIGHSTVYSLSQLPGLSIGMSVEVQPILYGIEPLLLVRYRLPSKDWTTAEVLPIELDEAGFDVGAATFGQDYKRPKETVEERNSKALEALAHGGAERTKDSRPFADANDGQGLVAHSFITTDGVEIKPVPKTGKKVEVTQADVVSAYDIRISAAEAVKRVKARSGWIPVGYLDGLKRDYPEGIPSALVDDLAAELQHGAGEAARFAKEA